MIPKLKKILGRSLQAVALIAQAAGIVAVVMGLVSYDAFVLAVGAALIAFSTAFNQGFFHGRSLRRIEYVEEKTTAQLADQEEQMQEIRVRLAKVESVEKEDSHS